jgi:hypothetical protein
MINIIIKIIIKYNINIFNIKGKYNNNIIII